MFATMVLITAAISRMNYLLGSWSTEIMAVTIVAPVFVYDLYTERRIHPATLNRYRDFFAPFYCKSIFGVIHI